MVEKHVARVSLKAKSSDFSFWQKQPYQARLAALEEIREEYIRWKYDAKPGIQRVYRIVKR